MSFTTLVKNEITQQKLTRAESIALLSAYLNINATFDQQKVSFNTENAAIARSIYKIIKETYSLSPIVRIRKQANFYKHHLYGIQFYDPNFVITEDLSLISNKQRLLVPLPYLLDDEETKRSYLAGIFLAKGSVNDPKTTRYHLEIILDNKKQANFINALINEFCLKSKIIKRQTNYVIYIKEAEKISDFLRLISAYNAVMYFEDIRIYRDHKNMTNRLNNCEQANIDKSLISSNELIKDINLIIAHNQFDLLNDKLKIAAEYKLKYPETSIIELSTIISIETGKNLSKSGLNHRFREIKNHAYKIKQNIKN